MANQEQLDILNQGVDVWNKWRNDNMDNSEFHIDLSRASLNEANLRGANLRGANLMDAELKKANLIGANLSESNLFEAKLFSANLRGANLQGANLKRADLLGANLGGANLTGASLNGARLVEANFVKANLSSADLLQVDLSRANLIGANLSRSDLFKAVLVGANLGQANLINARIYGISAWDLNLKDTKQENLIITPHDKSEITVDNIEIAQFIYLLINNEKIRDVITTLTSKAVLILGRFGDERKKILNSIKDECREMNLVPILFDFDPSPNRDLTETVQLLANLSRFVIADVTDAKSIPQELSHIIPNFPSVPVQPILLASQREYAMFEHWKGFNSVLPVFEYIDENHLLENFSKRIVAPVEKWTKEKDKTKILEEENAELKRQIIEMKRKSTDPK